MLCGHTHTKHKKQSCWEHLCAGILVYLCFYYSWVNAYERNNLFGYEKYLIILMTSPNRGLVGFHLLIVHSEFSLVVGFFLFVCFINQNIEGKQLLSTFHICSSQDALDNDKSNPQIIYI